MVPLNSPTYRTNWEYALGTPNWAYGIYPVVVVVVSGACCNFVVVVVVVVVVSPSARTAVPWY